MKTEAQRIAILTDQGWSDLTRSGRRGEDGPTQALRGTDPQGRKDRVAPNPLRCLNAMHAAEMICLRSGSAVERYRNQILAVQSRIISVEMDLTATAAQRAESFLKALNLWTE